MTLRAETIFG